MYEKPVFTEPLRPQFPSCSIRGVVEVIITTSIYRGLARDQALRSGVITTGVL